MTDEPVAVGKIVKSHGVRGECSVLVLTEFPEERFAPGAVLYLAGDRTLIVETSRNHHGRMLVSFAEIGDRNAADEVRGQLLFVPASELPDLPEGSYWPHQLVGCEVVTDDGRSLGTISEIISTPANDVWVAKDGETETMIPALSDVIVSVDVAGRHIEVRDVPGLAPTE
ncbi:MAG: ribosome maturation factor RimM [Actinomycetota bacterium]